MGKSAAYSSIYQLIESAESPGGFLLDAIAILEKSFKGTVWNAAESLESTAGLSFVRTGAQFDAAHPAASDAFRENKKVSRKLKADGVSGWSFHAPLESGGRKVGVISCLVTRKKAPPVEEAGKEVGFAFQQFRLKNRLLRDTILMNAIILSSQASASDPGIGSVLKIILPHLRNHLSASAVQLFTWDSSGAAFYGESGEKERVTLQDGNSLVKEVREKSRPLMTAEASAFPSYNPDVDSLGAPGPVSDFIAVPVSVSGDTVGVLAAAGAEEGRVFLGSDLVWMRSIAGEIGAILERNKLYGDLKKLFYSSVEALAAAIEGKDSYTHGHSRRVTMYSLIIAREYGLDDAGMENLRLAGLLHDIGKIAVPERILLKEDKLTDDEWSLMKQHPARGVLMLSPVSELERVFPGIRHHHERYDGSGYPDGLSGEEIPLLARIISVADAFDAITSKRSYREARSEKTALLELERCRGSQFDPAIADMFVKEFREKY